MRRGIASCALMMGLFHSTFSRAEETGSIMAALNDPAAECRYLAQLQEEATASLQTMDKLRIAYEEKGERAKKQIFMPKYPTRAETSQLRVAIAVFTRKQYEHDAAQRVLVAKRGNNPPCAIEKKEKGPAHTSTVTTPTQAPSLETQLQSLKQKRENKEITSEQYYEERTKLLEGF